MLCTTKVKNWRFSIQMNTMSLLTELLMRQNEVSKLGETIMENHKLVAVANSVFSNYRKMYAKLHRRCAIKSRCFEVVHTFFLVTYRIGSWKDQLCKGRMLQVSKSLTNVVLHWIRLWVLVLRPVSKGYATNTVTGTLSTLKQCPDRPSFHLYTVRRTSPQVLVATVIVNRLPSPMFGLATKPCSTWEPTQTPADTRLRLL